MGEKKCRKEIEEKGKCEVVMAGGGEEGRGREGGKKSCLERGRIMMRIKSDR